MGFLADGADNPISNPSALEITRVVFEHRRSLRAVLTLRPDRIMGEPREIVVLYINTLLICGRARARVCRAGNHGRAEATNRLIVNVLVRGTCNYIFDMSKSKRIGENYYRRF